MTSTYIYDPNDWEDPVMQELHWLRAGRAAEFNYDVEALLEDSAKHGKAVREQWERQKEKRESQASNRSYDYCVAIET